MSKIVYILNGPNLNLLGTREPEIYGSRTLADIDRATTSHAASLGLAADFRQSNHEGVMVDWCQEARDKAAGVIINAGAYTHTSIALLDALLTLDQPIIEVHLSNLYQREDFRHHSYISRAATGMICGLGVQGYLLALNAIKGRLSAADRPANS